MKLLKIDFPDAQTYFNLELIEKIDFYTNTEGNQEVAITYASTDEEEVYCDDKDDKHATTFIECFNNFLVTS